MVDLKGQYNKIKDQIDTAVIQTIESTSFINGPIVKEFGLEVDAYDYEADPAEVKEEYGIHLIDQIKEKYDGILLAVSHNKFSMINIESLKKDSNSVVYDLKGFFPRNLVDSRL